MKPITVDIKIADLEEGKRVINYLSVAIEALEEIKKHQELVGGPMGRMGSTWYIANKALEEINK